MKHSAPDDQPPPSALTTETGSEHLRELLLVRHAKSDWKEEVEDIERPISEKGKKAASRLGDWLKQNNLIPDLVLVSPSKRTQQTLKRLNLDKEHTQVETIDDLYLANLDALQAILKAIPGHFEKVMMIGHNPGFEALRQYLEKKPECVDCEADLFPTSTLAHFILPNNWQALPQGAGRLSHFIRPKDLKKAHKPHH